MRKLKLLTLILLTGHALAAAAGHSESAACASRPDALRSAETVRETTQPAGNPSAADRDDASRRTTLPHDAATTPAAATTDFTARPAAFAAIPATNAPTLRPDDPETPYKTINQRRRERGISSRENLFVPKGQWIFGGTISYSTHTNRDYDFMVVDAINSSGYTLKFSPMVSYAVANNTTLGVRFIYGRTLLKLDGASIKMGDEQTGIDLGVDYYYSLRHSYSFAGVWRQYIPFGDSKRFAIFTDTQLLFGGSQAKFAADSPIKGTFQRSFDFELGISPGLIAFATNSMAVEVNVGMMGISYSRIRQVHNQVTTGKRHQSAMNFKVNLLAIGLGVSFYL